MIPYWLEPQPTPPSPPVDPDVAREEKIANDTRVESEINRFIVAKQDAFFDAPDAFYRRQGNDAIHAAPLALQQLADLRDSLIDGLANDYQRQRLGARLDAHMTLARDAVSRHVAEQSLVWQRQIALDRIALLAKEAAHHHNDDNLIDALGIAATNAARAHARVGDGPIDADRESSAIGMARSRVTSAAIQARLDHGQTQGAAALFDRTRGQLDPAHAAPLAAQIQAALQPPNPQEPGEYNLVPVLREGANRGVPNKPSVEQKQDNDKSDSDPKPEVPHGSEDDHNVGSDVTTAARKPSSQAVAAASVALPEAGSQAAPVVGRAIANVAGRLAPLAAGAPSAALAAIPLILTPTNFQGGTVELGEGLRAQWKPGQRTATIERRVNNGLFGSGFAADWAKLPVDATYEAGPDGKPTLFVDSKTLEAAIGADAAVRVLRRPGAMPAFQTLPASQPSILEIRIGASANNGEKTTFREATHEEISQLCRAYPTMQEIGLRASMTVRATGLANGLKYGNDVHSLAKKDILKIAESEAALRGLGIQKLLPEVALHSGIKYSYRLKGSSVLDVLEIQREEKALCVYDFKTGNATFPDETVIRYARAAGKYAGRDFTRIYVIPIFVP